MVIDKKFPLSYSRVSCFKQCPAKFEHLYVNKSVTDEGNEHTFYGTRVHESLEKYARTGDVNELTNETREWKSLVDNILKQEGEKYYEYQMAINPACSPVDWFSSDVWFRGVADVLVINGNKATVLDWKTGKQRDDFTQLMIFASMVMFHFPEVDEVVCGFVWLKPRTITKAIYNRNNLHHMWGQLTTQLDKIQECVDMGVFTAKTSPLCNWCPAKNICIYR